jgi:tetratricopeptide (TPR) repeat protein
VRPEGGDYLFAHALVLEAVYSSLLGSRRRALHRRAAEWFARSDAVLHAEHLDRAQDPAAARAYLEAARAEYAEYRYEHALQLTERALTLSNHDATRYELTSLRGDLLRDLGAMQESLAAFRTALEMASEGVEKARAWIGIARSVEVMDRYYEALEALRHADSAIREQRLPELRAEIHHLRGNTYFTLSDIEGCLEQHEEALRCAREAGSARCEAHALSGLADAHYLRGRMHSAFEHFDRCVELCRAQSFGRIEIANLAMRGLTRSYQNDFQGGLQDCLAALETAVKVGDLRAEMLARDNTAALLVEMADWRGVQEHEERSLVLSRQLGARSFETTALGALGRTRAVLGDRATGEKLLRQAYALSREFALAFSGPLLLGEMALAVDDAETRGWALREGERLLRDGCVSHNYFYFYRDAIEVCLGEGHWDEADRYAQALEDYTRAESLAWSDFLIARARALAARGRGARDKAAHLALRRLRDEAACAGLKASLPAIEKALAE